MRRTSLRFAMLVAVLVGGMTHSVLTAADVVSIKRGLFSFQNGAGDLDISGNKGFRFVSRVFVSGGIFNPYSQCQTPDCPPGAVVSLEGRWIGNDARGSATFMGKTYDDVGGGDSDSGADIAFAGSVTMPPMSDGPVSVTAPFDFSGSFAYGLTGSDPQEVLLAGGGRVILLLQPNVDGNSWELVRADFEFTPVENR
jgi:hypothetical protein